MLQLQNLSKLYAGQEVVRNVSLDIPAHQVISLIGPNGAGKSTVLNMLARLTTPDGGTISLKNRDLQASLLPS